MQGLVTLGELRCASRTFLRAFVEYVVPPCLACQLYGKVQDYVTLTNGRFVFNASGDDDVW